MFTWKRLFLSLGFLFLIVIIGWTTWYFTIVRPKLIGNPIVLYNTKPQITAADRVNAAVTEKSQIRKNTQENGTAETHKPPKVRSQFVREGNKNATASLTQKESDKHTEHPDKSNGKKLSDEELAKRKADAERILKHYRTQIDELLYSTNELKKESERFKASYNQNEMRAKLVRRLNSLSAEDQQNYFEDIKSGKAVDDALETVRTTFKEGGIPDSFTEVFLELLKPQFSGESYAEKHLEELRAHGFEPKF
ncbi:MAG: hypothetical protein OXI67_08690 [Candidatus Poribacteria bacterium]|nr:hypothetical protein [Candidatus Poribacteria bacterium]